MSGLNFALTSVRNKKLLAILDRKILAPIVLGEFKIKSDLNLMEMFCHFLQLGEVRNKDFIFLLALYLSRRPSP